MDLTNDSLPSERKIIILVVFLFFNLILVSTNVVLEGEKTLFQQMVGTVVSPFQIAFQKTVDFVDRQLKHYVFLKDTYVKYRDLKQKHLLLKYENYLLKRKIEDVDFLEHLKTEYKEFIRADVISIDRNFPLNSIQIDKGSGDGIIKNMIVLNDQCQLVGKIVEPITPLSSTVRLVTSPAGGTGAYIKKNEMEGLLTGSNTKICTFKYLVENMPVETGDLVVTSGTDLIYPSNIPIGKVLEAKKEYLTQDIRVEPFFIKRSFKHLIVIKNSEIPPATAQ